MNSDQTIKDLNLNTQSRFVLWIKIINKFKFKNVLELGVYRGEYAEIILKNCPSIKKYYMIDPWAHLDNWNKPANKDNEVFDQFYQETLKRTDFAKSKRVVLRGKTTEVIDKIPDNSLDFAYVDGDHTLKGITIDLIRVYPKIKTGGWIGGDDFAPSIWQHSPKYEPTLIFPYSIYFAEAVSAQIYALNHNQFILQKAKKMEFSFTDLIGKYNNLSLKKQLIMNPFFHRLKHFIAPYYRYARKKLWK